jgi:riboflavin synthase
MKNRDDFGICRDMFTGIITEMGELAAAENGRMTIACGYDAGSIAIGASIACDGCCLTVVDVEPVAGDGCRFSVDVSNETLAHTTLGDWRAGRRVNLERALTLQSELGGHLVMGHVDAVARIAERREDGASTRFTIEGPTEFAHLVAEKGSVALDGVSLTVNEVDGARFGINVVPHTLECTTWSDRREGDAVNLEVDLLARYVARISDVLQRN